MINKKAEASVGVIIALVLGLLILVFLVLGFTGVWNPFSSVFKTNNIEQIKANCNIACTTNSQYDFCSKNQSVNDGENTKFSDTCYNLATDVSKYGNRYYGIASCPEIECPVQ